MLLAVQLCLLHESMRLSRRGKRELMSWQQPEGSVLRLVCRCRCCTRQNLLRYHQTPQMHCSTTLRLDNPHPFTTGRRRPQVLRLPTPVLAVDNHLSSLVLSARACL